MISRAMLKDQWKCVAMQCDECFEVDWFMSVFGFADLHQCFKCDAASYRKSVERSQLWDGVGELLHSVSATEDEWCLKAELPIERCSSPVSK